MSIHVLKLSSSLSGTARNKPQNMVGYETVLQRER